MLVCGPGSMCARLEGRGDVELVEGRGCEDWGPLVK